MQLKPKLTTYGATDHRWLGSSHGTSSCQTVTLDHTALGAFADDKVIPAGIPLKKGTGGKYVPLTAAGDTLAGFLFTAQEYTAGEDVVAPMLDHGRVRVDRLPTGAFDVTTLSTPAASFVFVKDQED